jgi:hypothetical protein
MRDEDHPLLKQVAGDLGFSQHDDINPDYLAGYYQSVAILNNPGTRMRALNDLDTVIGAEDGTTLKSKAQLLQIRQSLSRTHELLLKAGR